MFWHKMRFSGSTYGLLLHNCFVNFLINLPTEWANRDAAYIYAASL